METRTSLIKKLLLTSHLNTYERQLFSKQKITLMEIIECLKNELMSNKYFPPQSSNTNGIFEGYFIEKISSNEYILHVSRNHPINPFNKIEKTEFKFDSFQNVISEYISKEYQFNIDGIEILNDNL